MWLSALSLLWSVLTSRPGLLVVAGLAGAAWGYFRASDSCGERMAAREAAALKAQIAEAARQARATEKISLRDRLRGATDDRAAAAMQAEIERLQAELAKKEPPNVETKTVVVGSCAVDDDFARRVRRLDAAGQRAR